MRIVLGLLKWCLKRILGIAALVALYLGLVYAWGWIIVWAGDLLGKSTQEIDEYTNAFIVTVVLCALVALMVGLVLQNAIKEVQRLQAEALLEEEE